MESLRLAYSENAYRVYKPNTKRHIVKTTETDFLDVAAVVITEEDKDVSVSYTHLTLPTILRV